MGWPASVSSSPDSERECLVARKTYGFEKRQRELSKERKKEDKLQRKIDRKNAEAEPGETPEGETDHPGR
jgi:hypothetical protein